ncbi:stalk domain-containing protein [Defluviitalea saccharophila]|uniref:Phosphodiester glycosidase family protein n=1 Tax=Defluviitalea saccharophila TaxID=879970 RepID=A0ABZ2Y8F4_9FIRM
MKNYFFVFILVVSFIFQPTYSYGATASVWKETKQVSISTGNKTVHLVYVNLNDPKIQIDVLPAKGKVGQVDDLKNIANQMNTSEREAIAAINGTFFNSYDDLQPNGNIIEDGKVLHVGSNGTTIGFTKDNKALMDNVKIKVTGTINGSSNWDHTWYAWNINHNDTRAEATVIFTPEYGKYTPEHNKLSVVVENDVVAEIKNGKARIPSNGYTIVVGSKGLLDRFHVGDSIEYHTEFNHLNSGNLLMGWENVYSGVGAGPLLVKGGKIVANPSNEGFTSEKILTNQGQRSFIGVNENNIMIMGTVASANINELAEIAKKLGLKDAMNLDGGASSGLYYNGEYITRTGRQISNALVVSRLKQDAIKVTINGNKLDMNVSPVMKDGTVLVPLRAIFEALNINLKYDASTKTIYGKKENTKIILPLGKDATVNGQTVKLTTPAQTINGNTMVPVKFIAQSTGADVKWDGGSRTVVVTTK